MKVCNDAYGYGCTVSASDDEIDSVFRKYKGYYRNVCRECERKKAKEYRRKKPERRIYDAEDYGTVYGYNF